MPAAADFKATQAYVTLDYRTPISASALMSVLAAPCQAIGKPVPTTMPRALGLKYWIATTDPILYVKGTHITDSHYDSPATLGALLRDKSDVTPFS